MKLGRSVCFLVIAGGADLEKVAALQVVAVGRTLVEQRVVGRRPASVGAAGGVVDGVALGARPRSPLLAAVVEEVVLRPKVERRAAVRADRAAGGNKKLTNKKTGIDALWSVS